MPGGRPRKVFTPDQLELASKLAGYGLTNDQIANILRIPRSTINNHEELLDAIKLGKDDAAHELHKTAYELAVKDKNPAMLMFWLKCRAGWREKSEIDVNHQLKPIIIRRRDGGAVELRSTEAKERLEDGSKRNQDRE